MNLSRLLLALLAVGALVTGLLLTRGSRAPAVGGIDRARAAEQSESGGEEPGELAPEPAAGAAGDAPPEPSSAPSRVAAPAGSAPTLELTVVSEGGRPLPGVRWEVSVEGDREAGRREPRWRGASDATGRALLEVVPDRALSIWVPPTREHGWIEAELPALAAGQRVERELVLATGLDLDWYVQVASHGEPVAGARVLAIERASGEQVFVEETATDAAGLAHLRCRAWAPGDARIEAPGHGVALVEIREGHASPADACVVELWPSAALRVLVVDADGRPLEGVLAATELWGFQLATSLDTYGSNAKFRVEARTDAHGVALLEPFPAGLAFELRLTLDGAELLRTKDERPLSAGETTERRYVVAGQGTVLALAQDERGAPIEGVELWAVPGPPGEGHARVLDRERLHEPPAARAITGADGRAALEPLPLGRWTVGAVPPEGGGEGRAAELARGSTAPFVELTAEAPVARLTLHLAPPRAIAGVLVDEAGVGLGGLRLVAYGDEFSCARNAVSAGDGAFRIEPLPAGRYFLDFVLEDEPWIEPRVEDIEAGVEDLRIVLRRGGSLRGSVRDAATGELAPEVVVRAYATASDRPYVIRDQQFSWDGGFELTGLDEGPHALVAETSDGRIGVRTGLRVTPPDLTRDLALRVAPGVPVRLTYAGERPRCDVLVTLDGAKISYVAYGPGETQSFLVPPGRLELEIDRQDGRPERRVRSVAPGDDVELVVE